jgi:hypothetical protein
MIAVIGADRSSERGHITSDAAGTNNYKKITLEMAGIVIILVPNQETSPREGKYGE